MNTNNGIEISTSLDMTEYARCTIRSSVCCTARFGFWLRNASHAKIMPMPISVKAVGKPNMIATTIRPSIKRPKCPLVISDGGGINTKTPTTTAIRIVRPK